MISLVARLSYLCTLPTCTRQFAAIVDSKFSLRSVHYAAAVRVAGTAPSLAVTSKLHGLITCLSGTEHTVMQQAGALRPSPPRAVHADRRRRIGRHPRSHRMTSTTAAAGQAQELVDVAIAGGGLAGLVTAAALRRACPELSVKVFEQFPRYQKAGALLGLAPNAQKALHAIEPKLLQAAAATAVDDGRSITFDHRGNQLGERMTGAMIGDGGGGQEALVSKYGAAFMRLGWWEMHKAAVEVLPNGVICFDSKFDRYEETSGGVTVHFSSGSGGSGATCSAKLLIGADGGISGVRRQCLNDGLPKSPGTVLWRARVPAEAMAGLLGDGVVERSWIGGRMFANAWLVNSVTREGAWVGATNKAKLEEMGIDFKSKPTERTGMQVLPIGPTAHQRATAALADMPGDYQAMLAATDPESVVEHGTWARDIDPERPWGIGPVTLVGDAAHPVRPVTGQGFAQAAEDAHELAQQLAAHGLTPEALRAYERSRVVRVKRVADTEWNLGEMAYAPKGQDALAVQRAKMQQDDYAHFLFSKSFQPLA